MKPLYDVINLYSIVLTLFSVVVIILWAYSFRRDYTVYVLNPITRMVNLLNDIVKNPSEAISKHESRKNAKKQNTSSTMELELIEKTIGKFGSLLKVAFGEAGKYKIYYFSNFFKFFDFKFNELTSFLFELHTGMQIISQNMESSTFNPVQEGKRVIAIFGFCDIRKFSFCCSELKEDTIIFTNTIAQVVHNKVNDAGGSINKNMGDGFLAVWKVIEEKQEGLSRSRKFLRSSRSYSSKNESRDSFSSHTSNKTNKKPSLRRPSMATESVLKDMDSNEVAYQNGAQLIVNWSKVTNTDTTAKNNPLKKRSANIYQMFNTQNGEGEENIEEKKESTEKEMENVVKYIHFKTDKPNIVDESLIAFHKVQQSLSRLMTFGVEYNIYHKPAGKDEEIELLKKENNCLEILRTKDTNFQVKMAYGLHVGWAIEGAIGSRLKVDPSYVSPHVNFASKLQNLSKRYGVELLMSTEYVKHLSSPQLNEECRPIDVIQIDNLGAQTLYTHQPMKPDAPFVTHWLEAFDAYVQGKWKICRDAVKKCLKIDPQDGPCQMILKQIKKFDSAPENWLGYRRLETLETEIKKHEEENKKREEPLDEKEKRILLQHLDTLLINDNGKDSCSSKFSTTQELVTGKMENAINGINSLLGITEQEEQSFFKDGEEAIKNEIKQLVKDAKDTGTLKEQKQAEEIQTFLEYILDEKCSEKKYASGIRDKGRPSNYCFEDFMLHKNVTDASLSRAHVLALRLYTTPAYSMINNPLRDKSKYNGRHPMPATVLYIRQSIMKLRSLALCETKKDEPTNTETDSITDSNTNTNNTACKILWRGIQNVHLSNDYKKEGGTELAPMSTTSDINVALKYGLCSTGSIIFKILVPNALTSGADLKWISAFPEEAEVLYPPLTYLTPTGRIQVISSSDGKCSVTVIEVKPDLSAK